MVMYWELFANDHLVDSKTPILKEIPVQLNDENIEGMSSTISKIDVCPGNTDFVDLCAKKLEFRKPHFCCFRSNNRNNLSLCIN